MKNIVSGLFYLNKDRSGVKMEIDDIFKTLYSKAC